MAEKKAPLQKFNTPAGIARYPHLTKPDTKFNDEGEYKCDVVLDGDAEETTALLDYLKGILKAYRKTVKKGKASKIIVMPVFENELDDTDEETGNIIIRTKLKASGTRKDKTTWTEFPFLCDAAGTPLAKGTDVWSGSKLIVAGTVKPYDMIIESVDAEGNPVKMKKVGLSLQCRGVQVLELINAGEKSASSFGFEAQQGYTAAAPVSGDTDEDVSDPDDDEDGDEDEF